jgi:hypothetical protein
MVYSYGMAKMKGIKTPGQALDEKTMLSLKKLKQLYRYHEKRGI